MRLRTLSPFPFTVPHVAESLIGAGTEYPVGFSLADLVPIYELYISQANFHVACDGTNDYGEEKGGVYDASGDVIQGAYYVPPAPVTDERLLWVPRSIDRYLPEAYDPYSHLLCSAQMFFAEGYYPLDVVGQAYSFARSFEGPRVVYCEGTGLFYPRCALVMFLSDQTVPNAHYGPDFTFLYSSVLVQSTPPGAFPVTPGPRISIYGQEFEGYCYSTYDAASLGMTVTQGATMGIDKRAAYSFRGADGIALYNDDDGSFATNPATGLPFTLAELVAMPCP